MSLVDFSLQKCSPMLNLWKEDFAWHFDPIAVQHKSAVHSSEARRNVTKLPLPTFHELTRVNAYSFLLLDIYCVVCIKIP